MNKNVTITIDDGNEKNVWEASGVLVTLIGNDKGAKNDREELITALFGVVSDQELLMMLRYTLDKMQESLEDKDLAAIDLVEHMRAMAELAVMQRSSGGVMMVEHKTVQ